MYINLWFNYDPNSKETFYCHPNQVSASYYDAENIQISFDEVPLPTHDAYLLCKVNTETHKAEELLEVKPDLTSWFIGDNIFKDIRVANDAAITQTVPNRIAVFPKPDDLFVREADWQFATSTLQLGKYPLFLGPKGCGKTKFANSLATATQMEFIKINCGTLFKPKQALVGTVQADNGSTKLMHSKFLRAFESDKPTLIFLDELSRIPSSASNSLMTILDREQSYIYVEDEARDAVKGNQVLFNAAANFGFEYTDTRNQDGAFLDRFIKIVLRYLEPDEEEEMVHKFSPKAKRSDIKLLVQAANICRNQEQVLRVGVSSRQLIDMADYLGLGYSLKEVIDNIFVNLFYNGTQDNTKTVANYLKAISL
jgi:MoxR-like ATPase